MPKLNIKQPIKEKIAKANAKLYQSTNKAKLRFKTAKLNFKASIANTKTKIKNIKPPKLPKLPKIKFKIHLNLKKEKPEPETILPAKTLQKGIKNIDKYPLYEPFAQVFIVQDPKTGEHKYVLDELPLDPMERGIYNRILEILLAEIESPKDEVPDPRKFFAEAAKKIVDKYRISLGWLPDVSWYKILYHAERDLVGLAKSTR